jgi:GWxTD domain-containing protein
VLKGQLDLAGLPSGRYQFAVKLDIGGSHEERSDQFVMADFQETMEKEQARLAALKQTDEGYFGTMNEAQLDEAAAPLIYLASSDSLAVWKTGLSVAAKREFLTRFWQQRDPTPGTDRNETREAFYALISRANAQYAEGGRSATPGWRTDRGRIFVKYGQPSDMLDRRSSAGTAPPYQVWRYQRGKELYFIFADRSGFGAYKLLATNDLHEVSLPGYRDILGPEALQDVSRWLGIDLFRGDVERSTLQDN